MCPRNNELDGGPQVLRDVAMAANFWLWMGYNFGCMIARDTLFYTRGGFCGSSYPMMTYIANDFMRVVRLCLIPITGFSVNLASNHCVIALQDSTGHFPSTGTTRAISTEVLVSTTINPSYTIFVSHFLRL